MSTYDPIALGVTVGLDAIRADAEQAAPQPRRVAVLGGGGSALAALYALTSGTRAALEVVAQDGAE